MTAGFVGSAGGSGTPRRWITRGERFLDGFVNSLIFLLLLDSLRLFVSVNLVFSPPDGMALAWREWLSAWEEFHVEADEYRELDEERVLVLARFAGRGRTSGLEIGQIWTKVASVFQIRAGKVTKLLLYTDHRRALADLGLPE